MRHENFFKIVNSLGDFVGFLKGIYSVFGMAEFCKTTDPLFEGWLLGACFLHGLELEALIS